MDFTGCCAQATSDARATQHNGILERKEAQDLVDRAILSLSTFSKVTYAISATRNQPPSMTIRCRFITQQNTIPRIIRPLDRGRCACRSTALAIMRKIAAADSREPASFYAVSKLTLSHLWCSDRHLLSVRHLCRIHTRGHVHHGLTLRATAICALRRAAVRAHFAGASVGLHGTHGRIGQFCDRR